MSWMVSNSFITFQMPTINHIAPFFLLFKDVNLCTVLLQWISFSIWCMCVYIFLLSSWFNSIYQNLSLISVKCTLSSRSLCWRAWIVHSSFQFNSISLLCVWVREYKKKNIKVPFKTWKESLCLNHKSGMLSWLRFFSSSYVYVYIAMVLVKWLYEIFHRHMNDNAGNHLNLTCFFSLRRLFSPHTLYVWL